MGIIIGKFRKKKSTYEILEKLEKEIVSIEEFSRSTEQFRKKVITRFIILAILIYFVLSYLLYFYYHTISANQKLVYVVPLVAFPFIIFFIKKFLAWYYSKKLQRNEKKLVKLKEEKNKIIDNVMETETYKVAKKILDKFGSETTKIATGNELSLANTIISRKNPPGLRQRNIPPRMSINTLNTPTTTKQNLTRTMGIDKTIQQLPALPASINALQATPQFGLSASVTPLPLPRSILPANRSVLDKMVDYLVGDGPSNRYALICKKCFSHNGMALKEEFEYVSFRCCYCTEFNSARKKKVSGPKFEVQPQKLSLTNRSTDSDNDTEDSESESSEKSPETLRTLPVEKVNDSVEEKLSDSETQEGGDVSTSKKDTELEESTSEVQVVDKDNSDSHMEVDQPTEVIDES